MSTQAATRIGPARTPSAPTRSGLRLQRQCACGGTPGPSGECEACRKKRLAVQRRASRGASGEAPGIVHEVLRSPGHPLDPAARSFMEARFGHDFGRVRVHADARAAQSAAAVGAHAYTVGSHVVFATGRYAPQSAAGRHLLAHELAHVVQQTGAGPALQRRVGAGVLEEVERGEDVCMGTAREALDAARRAREADPAGPDPSAGRSPAVQPKLVVGRAGDPLEAEADRIADAVTRVPDSGLRPRSLPRTAAPAPLAVSRSLSPALIQRRVSYDVLDWDADRLGPPTPQNGSDPRLITVPPTGQVSISALVEVDGDASDRCEAHEVGTTQTAWMAWTVARYEGRNAGDGRITVRHRARMPMRDPSPAGGVWYDPSRVRSASACGEAVGVFHRDSPWHGIPKARNNGAVTGSPLNYLRHYTRGLHLVAYLTTRDAAGTFLPQPLRFVYWNSLQDFSFTPNFANPLQMWPYTGGVRVNIGGKGRGETADAPYFTTAGPNFNDHFNDSANWSIEEQP